MKINKKVMALALALSLGLGSISPTINSYAKDTTTTKKVDLNTYKEYGQNWLNSYKELEIAKGEKIKRAENLKKAEEKVLEKSKALVDESINKKNYEEKYNKEMEQLKKAYEESKDEATKQAFDEIIKKEIEDFREKEKEIDKKIEKAQKDLEDANREKTEETYKYYSNYTYKDIFGKTQSKKIDEAIEDLKEKEKSLRDDFLNNGGSKDDLDKMIKSGDLYIPLEITKREEKIEKLKNAIKENREMVTALKMLKRIAPKIVEKNINAYNKILNSSINLQKKANDLLKELEK